MVRTPHPVEAEVYSWDELCGVRGHGAVRVQDGIVTSVLCGGGGYDNEVGQKQVRYALPRRRYYRTALFAFVASKQAQLPLTVFQKIEMNRWFKLGEFTVEKIEPADEENWITLVRTS